MLGHVLERYFAFGSNLSSTRLRARIGDVVVVGVATLPDHRHLFNKHGNDDTAKGNIEMAPGEVVIGVLYEITVAQLETLVAIESGYERVTVSVTRETATIDAVTFRAVRLADHLAPTREYLDHYVHGVREHGIEEGYLEGILPAWYGR